MKSLKIDTQKIVPAACNFFTTDRNLRILLVFSVTGICYGALQTMSGFAWFLGSLIYAAAAFLLYTAINHLPTVKPKEVSQNVNNSTCSE